MSFGFVSAAVATLKGNRALKRSQKNKFKANNRNGIYSEEKGEKLEFKEVSEEELILIKQKIHQKLKENQQRQFKILLVSIVIDILVLFWIF